MTSNRKRVLVAILATLIAACDPAASKLPGTSSPPTSLSATPSGGAEDLLPESTFHLPDPGTVAIGTAECLEELGFVATVDGDQVSARVPPDQAGELAIAIEKCSGEGLGLGPGDTVPPPTYGDYERLYTGFVASADCLASQGLEVSDPPSLASFVESKGQAWNPFEPFVPPSLTIEQWEELTDLCPQPSLYNRG